MGAFSKRRFVLSIGAFLLLIAAVWAFGSGDDADSIALRSSSGEVTSRSSLAEGRAPSTDATLGNSNEKAYSEDSNFDAPGKLAFADTDEDTDRGIVGAELGATTGSEDENTSVVADNAYNSSSSSTTRTTNISRGSDANNTTASRSPSTNAPSSQTTSVGATASTKDTGGDTQVGTASTAGSSGTSSTSVSQPVSTTPATSAPVTVAPTVSTPTASCDIYVSTSGSDSSSGATSGQALRNPTTAANRASAGDVVCIDGGNYAGLDIDNKHGSSSRPIEFRSINGEAIFSHSSYTRGDGVEVNDSSHIIIDGLAATNSLRGINVKGSNEIEVLNCRVWNIGQEGIHIGSQSSNVRVAGCDVSQTGNRQGIDTSQNLAYSVFGELVYVGTGSSGGDATNNVVIENNVLHDNGNATAEAVNVKSSTRNITVRNNHVYNIDSWCEAAIRVNSSSGLVVAGNVIHDVWASGFGGSGNTCRNAIGIRFDAAGARVENNIVFRAGQYGILADRNSSGTVANNTLFDNGQDFRKDGSSSVSTSGNLTSDGTNGRRVSASDFVGPLSNTANAGAGPGSGFRLR